MTEKKPDRKEELALLSDALSKDEDTGLAERVDIGKKKLALLKEINDELEEKSKE